MASTSGRTKGMTFERDVCRLLSLWISAGSDADLFWRSASSGGRATTRGDASLTHAAGDIAAVKVLGFPLVKKFFIECKSYKDLGLHRFMCNEPSNIGRFWEVASAQAKVYHRCPLLIAKQVRLPTLILINTGSWLDFGLRDQWHWVNDRLTIGLFAEFLAHANAQMLSARPRMLLRS